MPNINLVIDGELQELTIDGVRYTYLPEEETPAWVPAPTLKPWAFPVGDGLYPPEMWYCATVHDPTGALNDGYKHTGIDLNLDVSPWGDIERTLGLSVYALAEGAVTYSTPNWSGVPMIVVRHEHAGDWLWVRYAHIGPEVPMVGTMVERGDLLGGFANWKTGDHLHLDMALDEFTREWLAPNIRWRDPVPVLKEHLDPAAVDTMLART